MLAAVDALLEKIAGYGTQDAVVYDDKVYTYNDLTSRINEAMKFLSGSHIAPYSTVMLEAGYSPMSVAMLLALLKSKCIVIPALRHSPSKQQMLDIAEVQYVISVGTGKEYYCERISSRTPTHLLFKKLQKLEHGGIILFSSGSTGVPKAAVHDAEALLKKYTYKRYAKHTLAILLFDHIGGLDNLFYTISNGGCLINCSPLTPEEACRLTEKYKAEVFPASPSFLNLLLLSEAYKRYDLASVETVTYGAEVMPQYLLLKMREIFPNARLLQKYGVTEIGTLRSHSESSDSLWVRIGGEGFQTRVVDGMLQIKAESAMLGYLNAPSPFTEDGWFMTGDEVEVKGDYYLIKGRRSEIINVGGQKVYPAEVESVILQMPGVLDAAVSGEKNPILGNIVTVKVHLENEETVKDFTKRMKLFCKDKLQSYQTPQKVTQMEHDFTNARFKKIRR